MILYSNGNSKSEKIETMLKENDIDYEKVYNESYNPEWPILVLGNKNYNYVQVMDMFTTLRK